MTKHLRLIMLSLLAMICMGGVCAEWCNYLAGGLDWC